MARIALKFVVFLASALSFAPATLHAQDASFTATDLFDRTDERLDLLFPAFERLDDSLALSAREELDAAMTFGASASAASPANGATVYVERQDYSSPIYGASCVGEPFVVGSRTFSNGIGTHADSRLRVQCGQAIARFKAQVGLNAKTPGSVQFALSTSYDGDETQYLWRSEVVRGGDEPIEVDVTLPSDRAGDKRVLYLYAFTTDDGPSFDQANWLDPVVVLENGQEIALGTQAVTPRLETSEPPFSFTYDGVSSREFLKSWTFERREYAFDNGVRANGRACEYRWTDPKTKLVVAANVRYLDPYGAADWIVTFENQGSADTPLIENVLALDATLCFGADMVPWTIHTLKGDNCDATSWAPLDRELDADKEVAFAPVGGRSSNGAFPFWNILPRKTTETEHTDGVFFALGWTGQWNANFTRVKDKRSLLRATAGMETFASVLRPGEKIRMPRALYMPWSGDRVASQALFGRMMMENFTPKSDRHPVRLDLVEQCFDRYYRKRAGWERCDAQIESAQALKAIGGTAYWFDAAWFPVGFPNGVGNWYSDKTNFPNGVEELGVALKAMDMRFILWFEPERVAANTEIANEYPDYVFGGKNGGLYKLNDPAARKFLQERLLKCVKDFKVDVYRNDFNIDPYSYWLTADEPNRKGMTEIRYVEGLYETWDALIAANPGLWIDNCASGGRRIDLETLSRSVPLWRSDTCCWPGHPEWDQAHTVGIAQFLPLYSCSSWSSDEYTFRSAANPGAIMQYDFLDTTYDQARAKASLDEAKTYQKFWYGDFYPLTPVPEGVTSTVAWQLHRADLDAGLIYVFRQSDSRYPMVEIQPREIDFDAEYLVRVRQRYGDGERKTMSGKELYEYNATLKEKASSCVIEYMKTR